MASLGTYNTLPVIKEKEFGLYLDAGRLGEVLLPRRYVPADTRIGDALEVFVYLDSEDCPIATTERPRATVGQFASLRAVSVGAVGAFLDWGLPKDLLLPFGEQKRPVEVDQHYLVRIYLDNSNRIAASTRLNRFLDKKMPHYRPHQEVSLIIAERTELGYKAIVDHAHGGVIHHQDLQQTLRPGQSLPGYIKQQRPDGKLDLLLRQPGYGEVGGLSEQILQQLRQHDGYLPLNDRSDASLISRYFGTSKKKFKMALGALYKRRLISLEADGIRLLP